MPVSGAELGTLTIVAQNLKHGGWQNDERDPEDRWPLLAERIKSVDPDVVLICEATAWDEPDKPYLARALEDLGMKASKLSDRHPNTGYPVGVLYKPQRLGEDWARFRDNFSVENTHGMVVPGYEVGLPKPLSFLPTHINPFVKEKAMMEAGLIASRAYANGPYAVIGGDINWPPNDHIEPDLSDMRPYNFGARMEEDVPEGEPPRPFRRVARRLEHYGLTDVAKHLYLASGDESLLAITAGEFRIDQFWVTKPLVEAVSNYRLLRDPVGASDHAGIAIDLDLDKIDTSNPWGWR